MSKNYKRRLNPVWHRMVYSRTHMATVDVKGLTLVVRLLTAIIVSRSVHDWQHWTLRNIRTTSDRNVSPVGTRHHENIH